MSQGKLIGNHLNWEKDGEQKFLKNDESNIVTFVCKKCGYLESYVK
jgi:predicted nucleic-acid-binding Zn-ribbon protein